VRLAQSLVCPAVALALFAGCSPARRNAVDAGPAPKNAGDAGASSAVSADASASTPPFVYSTESFADLRILRYQVHGFDALTLKQKTLLYYLQEASLSGRDITYDQKFAHNLLIRRTLEAVVNHKGMPREPGEYRALVTYLKRMWFSNGIHHHASNRKFLPEGLRPETFAALVREVSIGKLPVAPGETVDQLIARLTPIMFDPTIAVQTVDKDASHDPVSASANHFYVNLTRAAVLDFNKAHDQKGDPTPISLGLNSQLVGKKDGSIEERVWKLGGMYGTALGECLRWLDRAWPIAENEAQAEALRRLATFYRSGDLEDFDRYNVAWVKDNESSIDLIHGFIETYGDPLNMRGTYEAMVELNDTVATRRIRTISEQAQWFEDNSPIAKAFKKEKVVGINARVVQVVMAAGDSAPAMPGGVNLPNADWIRTTHGSKSVTLGNVLEASEAAQQDSGVLEEFAASTREVERARSYGTLARALLVDMHEVIGHASGKLSEGVQDVSSTLGHYGSTLEEARADLVALYYLLDPRLIELKLVPSLEVGRAAYDSFMRGALVQMARVPVGQPLEEAHMRNRQLIAHWVMQEGASDGVIERLERGGKTFFVVREYPKLRKLFGELLTQIQRIKSEGDFESARDLVDSHGVKLEPELHKQIIERYRALRVAPYAGFIQPRLIPVIKDEQVVDVHIEYPTDFAAQQLEYSAKYSFLPTVN